MNTYIALLRGINVGGHRKVPMAELRTLLIKEGLKNVKTYIQSGNVIFQSAISHKAVLETRIKNAILNHFGFEVIVIVLTRVELNTIFNNSPFPQNEKAQSYFAILNKVPSQENVSQASKKVYDNEFYHIIDNSIYFYCANGYGRAKFSLTYFEKKLEVNATARNYKTLLKLLSMAEESESPLLN